MTNTFYSSCPEVRRTQETFVQYASIGGVQQRHEFQREVVWLRESEAYLRLVHRGYEVMELCAFNDFYGYLSAIKPEKSELDAVCRTYGIDSSTKLALIVVATIFEHPVIETPEVAKANREKPTHRKHQWATVPDDWRKEVEIAGDKTWPRLERIELESRVVWSSKNDEPINARLLEEFCSCWQVPVLKVPA